MGSEWQMVPISDVSTPILGGTPKRSVSLYWGGPVKWASAKDIASAGNRYIYKTSETITSEGVRNSAAKILPKGTIIITARGTVGALVQLGSDMAFNQTCYGLITKKGILSDYLFYALKGSLQRMHTLTYGTVFETITKKTFDHWIVPMPSLPEQRAIAHILSTLDDKIELNRQMNSTLESMAQAMFKSWFVDFDPVIDNALAAGNPIPDPLKTRAENRRRLVDQRKILPQEIQKKFPSRFVFTEDMGWIPEGWGVKEAQEIATITIGKTPPRKEKQWFSVEKSTNYVWVSIKDMGNAGVFIGDSSEYLTPESVARFNVKVVPKGSVILSFKLTLGRVAIAQSELTTNEAIAHFTTPKFELSKEFIYSYLSTFEYGSLGSTSSIATAINSKIIKTMPFLVPSQSVLKGFEKVTKYWFAKINGIIDQSCELTQLRDTLLPKLISGQLRLPDSLIDKFAEQADSHDAEQIISEAI